MSSSARIGEDRTGEWLERYAEAIFRYAGFITERDRYFHTASNVRHEIDVFADSEFAQVAVECKDWGIINSGELKKELDAFISKVRQIDATTGVFVVNDTDTGQYRRFREYMKENGLGFWDKNDLETWHGRISHKSKENYMKELCDSLRINFFPKTKSEKVLGFLKKASKVALTTSKVAYKTGKKIVKELDEPPRRRKKKRSKKVKHRRYHIVIED